MFTAVVRTRTPANSEAYRTPTGMKESTFVLGLLTVRNGMACRIADSVLEPGFAWRKRPDRRSVLRAICNSIVKRSRWFAGVWVQTPATVTWPVSLKDARVTGLD
jgi:hypothetical protein